MMFSRDIDTAMQRKMLSDTLSGLILVVVGIAGVVCYKFDGDIELFILSIGALTCGLGVVAAGSVRKELYDYIQGMEENRKV
jgi:hypothetical protein